MTNKAHCGLCAWYRGEPGWYPAGEQIADVTPLRECASFDAGAAFAIPPHGNVIAQSPSPTRRFVIRLH